MIIRRYHGNLTIYPPLKYQSPFNYTLIASAAKQTAPYTNG